MVSFTDTVKKAKENNTFVRYHIKIRYKEMILDLIPK